MAMLIRNQGANEWTSRLKTLQITLQNPAKRTEIMTEQEVRNYLDLADTNLIACRTIRITSERKPILAEILSSYGYTYGQASDALLAFRFADWKFRGTSPIVEASDFFPSAELIAEINTRVKLFQMPKLKAWLAPDGIAYHVPYEETPEQCLERFNRGEME